MLKIQLNLICEECGRSLDYELQGDLTWRGQDIRVDVCEHCMDGTEEEAYKKGKSDSIDEGR